MPSELSGRELERLAEQALQALIAARPYVLAASSDAIVLELEQLDAERCRRVLDELDGAIGGLQELLS